MNRKRANSVVERWAQHKDIFEVVVFNKSGEIIAHNLSGNRIRKVYLMFLLSELEKELGSSMKSLTTRSLVVGGSAGSIRIEEFSEDHVVGAFAIAGCRFENLSEEE